MVRKILVIEDDADTTVALLRELRDRGYRIVAIDAIEAEGQTFDSQALDRPEGNATGYRQTVLRVGPLCLDLIDRTAWREGRRIELRSWEFRILEYFMRHPARIVPRERLLCDVWRCNAAVQTNRIDVHLSTLRRKLDSGDLPPMLHNVRGVGFILEPPS